ncbi:heme o synthase [Blochmannia endosymbiont of Polyrhachis (Hedomyrma) turneri]|uniref:heme o synthase n=1 Tax=Blochmannia endosymbiont of Polyrhachis (Hedomyrma) turneri TaxID=1505596 RepID=UPI00061A80B5|nr:heme o synthase [Blochmannia endosymbiont of Polyrhachis (Hedomyrma) turneri]AKC59811.1 Protoheme IX farnesyltransferase [Blochmannia endosymbiont of Polyrhachis (Hedomyrma) turneri]
MIIHYITIIKPKIIFGNILSIIGGFFMASKESINYNLLTNTIIGVSLIIASNCVINNIIDRNIDALMERTKHRTLAKKLITLQNAGIYAIILLIVGYIILFYTTNLKVIYLTIISSIIYVGMYSLLTKKQSMHSTLIGSIAGATPPVIGYCAVTNNIDVGALILSIILISWQIPHFYSLAISRIKDYKTASIPIFPLKKGIKSTKRHMIFYITTFMINIIILTFNQYMSYIFLLGMEVISGIWLYVTFLGDSKTKNNNHYVTNWANKIFAMSIIIIILFNVGIVIDTTILQQT